jgi:hypothetical protein
MCKQKDFYKDFIKSALYVALANISDKSVSDQLRQHVQILQSMGVGSLVLTIKGTSLSAPIICSYEIDIPSGYYLEGV